MSGDTCEHEPDMTTVSITEDWPVVYVDVNCKKCGASGCFGKFSKQDEVDW